jgi:peroxiredoxin
MSQSQLAIKRPQLKLQAYHQGDFKTIDSSHLEGKWNLFFFYPADFTFICPTELGDLADKAEEFKKCGVDVYSVSTDTHFTHKAWHDASDTVKKIHFPMLADPTCKFSKSLGVFDEENGVALRATFLFNPTGDCKLIEINDDGIGRNADELLRKVQAALFVAKNPGQVCPAKWKPGQQTLKPSLDLVGKI